MKRTLAVGDPGPHTTVQDLGRFGLQRLGVPVAGALDGFAARMANLLVGNDENHALLEMTFLGARLEAQAPMLAAVTGGEFKLSLNGQPAPLWTCLALKAGDKLAVGAAQKGIRAYLAVDGGIAVPRIMGSRSTYVGAALGGLEGRPLAKGDLLPVGEAGGGKPGRSLPKELRPQLSGQLDLRALPGPQDDYFDQGLEVFYGSPYKVGSHTDRMGCRLEGPAVLLKQGVPQSIISEPSVPGGVQIPAEGQPIILLVEQTVGGYAKIATVLTPDLGQVAQARPGDTVHFIRVGLAQARRIYREYQERLGRARELLTS